MLTISLLAVAVLVPALASRVHLRSRPRAERWRVVTRTLEDGRRQVALAGPGSERLVKELPADLDGLDLEIALGEARSRAFDEALRLNEPLPAAPAPAARTRS
jgi:hypothetical protein